MTSLSIVIGATQHPAGSSRTLSEGTREPGAGLELTHLLRHSVPAVQLAFPAAVFHRAGEWGLPGAAPAELISCECMRRR